MTRAEWHQVISRWRLPDGDTLQDRIEQMIRPALYAGFFGESYTHYVAGLQYHLGGQADTAELASLANITARDHVLDVGCFIGGPAMQLAETFKCRATGVDIAPNCIAAANRIAELAGLAHLATFRVADAGNLPFDDEIFSVVWNQGSLEHYATWLREFDRVLAIGGRMAITFEIGNNDPIAHDYRWRLEDVVRFIESLGYNIEHADDVTQRDIEIGWKALDRQLTEHEREFAWLLGADWVRQAHTEFARAIAEMQRGEWGNGRIVARKSKAIEMRVNYDEISLEYDRRYDATLPERGKPLIELASQHQAERILEVGCGTGYWLAALRMMFIMVGECWTIHFSERIRAHSWRC